MPEGTDLWDNEDMATIAKQQPVTAPGEESLRELRQLREENAQLARAVNQSRDINVVVGILMERFRLDRQRAFDALRRQARARRMKLEDLALALLGAEEQLQRFGARHAAGPATGKAGDSPSDH